jgi:predicted phosphoribosyltransferase
MHRFVMAPEPSEGVGKWYDDFSQTTDQEVQFLMQEANRQFLPE